MRRIVPIPYDLVFGPPLVRSRERLDESSSGVEDRDIRPHGCPGREAYRCTLGARAPGQNGSDPRFAKEVAHRHGDRGQR